MRTLILISLDWTRPKDPPLSLGHASLLTQLKENQINVIESSWSVNDPNFKSQEVSDFIIKNSQDKKTDVALGVFIWNEKSVQSILNSIKDRSFTGRIILGGPQISYVKNDLERYYPQAHIFIRGYAENALVKLMKSEHNSFLPIPGVLYAGQQDLKLSTTTELENLTSPFLTELIKPQRFIRWETQRGCPFRCAFCQHRESDISMTRRQFSLSRILQEAQWITQHPIIQDIAVIDPIFNSGPYYLNILDHLKKGKYTGKISFQSRIEMVNDDFLDKICHLNETATTVLEFGLQTIHSSEQMVIDRPNNMRRIEAILTKIQKLKIKIEISLIFGLPNQTITSFKQSIDFCRRYNTPVIHAFPLMLLRGTPLYYQKNHLGLVESNEIASSEIDRLQIDIPHVVSSPSFTYNDWKQMAEIAANLEKENHIH